MKNTAICILLCGIFLAGCAQTKELCKGALGVSTRVLEEERKEAIRKEFNYDLITCHNKVRQILKDIGSYIYCDDLEKDMLAVYVSEEDTTPVGIFLTSVGKEKTLIEVSSPSVYGKEAVSKSIFASLTTGIIKPLQKGMIDADKDKKEPKKSY